MTLEVRLGSVLIVLTRPRLAKGEPPNAAASAGFRLLEKVEEGSRDSEPEAMEDWLFSRLRSTHRQGGMMHVHSDRVAAA